MKLIICIGGIIGVVSSFLLVLIDELENFASDVDPYDIDEEEAMNDEH